MSEKMTNRKLAAALTDVIYGEMLCWDMSGGAYSFEERTETFCAMFLPAMMKPYLNGNANKKRRKKWNT